MTSVLLPRDFFGNASASCMWKLSRRRANTSQPVAPEGRSKAAPRAKDALGKAVKMLPAEGTLNLENLFALPLYNRDCQTA